MPNHDGQRRHILGHPHADGYRAGESPARLKRHPVARPGGIPHNRKNEMTLGCIEAHLHARWIQSDDLPGGVEQRHVQLKDINAVPTPVDL